MIFIIGTGHCGSTLLDCMLGSHSLCFSLGEFKQLPFMYKQGGHVCGVCDSRCPFWENTINLKTLVARLNRTASKNWVIQSLSRLLNPYSYIFSKLPNTNILIDSSKSISWVQQQITSMPSNIRTMVVFLLRDGRALVGPNG